MRIRAALVVVALVAGACSSSDDEPDTTTTAAVALTTTTRVEPATAPAPLDCEQWRYDADDEPAPGVLPAEFDRADYKRTSLRDPRFAASPADHCGQMGAAVDLAWGITQGRDDVRIAVLDSGIEWRDTAAMLDLATKAYINPGEARPPCAAPTATTGGTDRTVVDTDCNGDGVFDITDFGAITDRNANGLPDPEDLILDDAFSDGVDDDDNGYVDDISGWDFLYGDNNPLDTVAYGHGTGEALDSTAAANGFGDVGTCPRCRFVPVRVSDSFVADGGRFAAGVLFAVDSGAAVVQEALGAVTNPRVAQDAIDLAWEHDVVVVASMADEASKHANLPGLLDRTLAVNSVTEKEPLLGGDIEGYLALNGCTNFGGRTLVSVPSSSCSSEATGIMSGVVGLVVSAARDGGRDLTAGEIVQLARATADDVDFSGDLGASTGEFIDTVRYPTTPGWDATFGYGRINAYEMVRTARDGGAPVSIDLESPRWFEVVDPAAGPVEVVASIGRFADDAVDVRVEWAAGLQPPEGPATDSWHVVAEQLGRTGSGEVRVTVDLSDLEATGVPYDATNQRPAEERFTARLRVVVTAPGDAADRVVAIDQHQIFVHTDPDLIRYDRVDGAGTSSPVFAQLDADAGDELLVATDDGRIHAYDVNGDELDGFPLRNPAAAWWPTESTAGHDLDAPGSAFMVGVPKVVELDGDAGNGSEIVAADIDGNVWAWHTNGERVRGFAPVGDSARSAVRVDDAFSRDDPAAQDAYNRTKPGIYAQPAIGDLDGDDRPEIVVAAADRHLYAWHGDGTTVDGFPVQLVDPAKVAAIDATTHKVTFAPESGVAEGGELIAAPVIGDVNGDDRPDIVVGAQESYEEPVNIGDGVDVLALLGAASTLGNTRLYAVDAAGRFLRGWPAKLGMVALEVLPTIGGGVLAAAVIADVHPNPGVEVVAASAAGPAYVLGADATSVFGRAGDKDLPLTWAGGLDGAGLDRFGAQRTTTDTVATFVSFGAPTVADLDGDGDLDVAAPGGGLTRLLDVQAADLQLPNDDHLLAWDGATGDLLAGFPHTTSDMAFFVTPVVVDLAADGTPEVIAGNGLDLLTAVAADGTIPDGWPKLTGGWLVGTAAVGDLEGDGRQELAVVRRDGVLLVWHTSASAAVEGDD